jgi:micrococcal nuclease
MRARTSTIVAAVVLACCACTTASDGRAAEPPGVSDDATFDGPYPVVDVVDGDTLEVETPERITIRVIGIDTPETVDPRRPVECFGREASARAHELLDRVRVSLEYDLTQGRLDRFGRTLAYVWLPDGRSFGEAMIAEGYAHEYTYDTPYKYRESYRRAEAAARDADRGLWGPGTCDE